MNCKEGDLAIIVNSQAGNEGKIVQCIKYIGTYKDYYGNDRWKINTPILNSIGKLSYTVRDSQLRPIRDSDKEDEMLNIIKIKEPINA